MKNIDTTAFYTEAQLPNIGDWDSILKPPHYFESCKLGSVDFAEKKIQSSLKNWPVAVAGDSCSNSASMDDLVEQIGFVTPSARCTDYVGDGSIKSMTNSATVLME